MSDFQHTVDGVPQDSFIFADGIDFFSIHEDRTKHSGFKGNTLSSMNINLFMCFYRYKVKQPQQQSHVIDALLEN